MKYMPGIICVFALALAAVLSLHGQDDAAGGCFGAAGFCLFLMWVKGDD